MLIGDVARRSGLQASAIRYYESLGLLPEAKRVNGRRHYDADVLQRLAVILMAQQVGFTLAEVQTLLDGFAPDTPPRERWGAMAGDKIAELEQQINRAQRMKQMLEAGLDCECLTLAECATRLGVSEGGCA